MTNTFETTLGNITSQVSDFESRDERAVEIAAVLPLLKSVGWNTTNLSEIYPQHGLAGGGIVDYDLQIDGESRILIEVKRWGHDLHDEDESQLEAYCQSTRPRPKLGILTNGRIWRLYVAPTASKGKNSVLKRFGEVDITATELVEVERIFNQFLSRKSMVDFRPTLNSAQDLHHKLRNYQEQRRLLTEALSELANDENMQIELVSEFAEKMGLSTDREIITRVLESFSESLVRDISTKVPQTRPASFVLTTPNGRKKTHQLGINRKGWNSLLLKVCELMEKQHPENFHQNVLSLEGWFARSCDSRFEVSVGGGEIYARRGTSGVEIKKACYEIVTKFGYPKDSLVIKDSRGAIL